MIEASSDSDLVVEEARMDEAFAPLRDNILGYAEISGELRSPEAGFSMTVERIEIETPIELGVYAGQAGGPLAIGCAPPLYRVSTTLQPVFHQLRMTLVPVAELLLGVEE